jgi:hypothetical protein
MTQINKRFKKIIFNKLYKDLSHLEIIPYKNSVWFIDRNEKYWYLEFEKSGHLWWRYQFFTNFFRLFSMDHYEFEPIISEWVEEILNRKVVSTKEIPYTRLYLVEEILNSKVLLSYSNPSIQSVLVEEALNSKY